MKTGRSPTPQIIEMDGNRYVNLEMAQIVALGDVAQAVANVVREGLAKGKLVVYNGQVTFMEDQEDD